MPDAQLDSRIDGELGVTRVVPSFYPAHPSVKGDSQIHSLPRRPSPRPAHPAFLPQDSSNLTCSIMLSMRITPDLV